jgi:hypothetical protein
MRDRARACAYVLAGVVAGCKTPYLDASRQFATSAAAGVAAFDGVFDLASSLCRRRARYAYVFFSLDGGVEVADADRADCPLNRPGHPREPIAWADYYATYCLPVPVPVPVPAPSGSGSGSGSGKRHQTWIEHCAEIATADQIVGNALVALGSYADALGQIAGADYSGADTADIARRSSALAGQVPANGTRIAEIAKGLADPVGALSGALERRYAEDHVGELVVVAAPSVSGIISALQRYQSALVREEADAQGYVDELSDRFEARVARAERPAAGCGMDPLILTDIELRWGEELRSNLHLLDMVGDGLKTLAQAADALKQAADAPDPDRSAALKTVVAGSAIIAHDVNALVLAVRGQGG